MIKRIAAMVFIFLCTTVAWLLLGATVNMRTQEQDRKLKSAVGQLWGTPQHQQAPTIYYLTEKQVKVETTKGAETVVETKEETVKHGLPLESSDIKVGLDLDYRRKGLLWYSTYKVGFSGKYGVSNPTAERRKVFVNFVFPQKGAVYGDFRLSVGGREVADIRPADGQITQSIELEPGQGESVEVAYESQGMDEWWYEFGADVSQVKNFSLSMSTNFDGIDFPQNSISPTGKSKAGAGWDLKWEYRNLLSGVQIGMAMPRKLNPGPLVSKVTLAAPVSLFLFLFLMLIITARRRIDIHPMNYFFICAAFFAFHLLLAYTADHLPLNAAFALCAAVSIFLVISYMRIVAGVRFAFLEIGLSQLVYLVLFSCTFFFEEYTGLAVTVLCIVTLFITMQYTARVDWRQAFSGNGGKG